MKYYAVIDTNVLVSAMLKWDSVPGTVLEFAVKGIVIPVINDTILNEYREALSRKKFRLTEEIIDAILVGIIKQAIFVTEEHLDMDLPDPKDVVFYEVVMEQRQTEEAYLVTGNMKHFPIETFVVTPRQFLDIIIEKDTD